MGPESRHHRARQGANARVVLVVAEVQDLPLARGRSVHDAQKSVDELVDVKERPALAPAIHQHQILSREQGVHEHGEHARNAFAVDAGNEIHARADDVERSDHGELEFVMLAIGADDSLE